MMRSRLYLLGGGSLLLLAILSCGSREESPTVREGTLDLRAFSFADQPILNLDGTWEFYWHRLLSPDAFDKEHPSPDLFLSVPESWNGAHIAGQELTGIGYGTYRVKILLPAGSPPLSLKLLDAGSAYRLWVNGRPYGQSGSVGSTAAEARPSYRTAVYDIMDPGSEVELIFQVANFHHRKGGLWETVKLGTVDAIHGYREHFIIFEGFVAGALAIMGLYHFGIFALRRRDRSAVWFGLFCLDIAVRITVTGERMLHGVLPDFFWPGLVKAEYITMMIGLPSFLLFLRALYPNDISRVGVLSLVALEGLLILFVLVTPVSVFSYVVEVHHGFILLGIIVALSGLIRAISKGREAAILVFISCLLFILTVVNDILYNQQIVFTFQMVGFGLFLFIFSQSFVLSVKFSRAFATVEGLSDDLKRQNTAYSHFVPTEFLRLLKKDSILDIALGDQIQTEMSVLFVDIRSFTAMSERMTPKENFDFLNDYLGRIGPLIRKSGGYIDKYLGDGLMALFPEKPEPAIEAALEIQKAVAVFNQELVQSGRPAIRVGSAIHTGRLMLGTVGEHERMDGTVISDAVNLAARLEGLTRSYGSSIVISDATLQRIDDPTKYCARFLGKVRVRGKTEAVSIFELFDLDPREVRIIKQVTRTEFEKAVVLLHGGEYDQASLVFEGILRANPEDEAARLYVQKIETLKQRRRYRA